ncbi:hypothetical protein [Lamprocystis purpurea]|uniref:hypothetical protein n=1 Tax=Lamprocystis purpurea TaxID=61598 RepID=UPI0012F8A407|nr:hypothetical protein [Lamprocystis purpurea]
MATQYATILSCEDGDLWIDLQYAPPRTEASGSRLEHGKDFLGVPFERWAQHIGETVDLSTWEGTGEGMVGGPDRCQIADYLGGPLEFVSPSMDKAEIKDRIRRTLSWLDDENYEYLPSARKSMAWQIRHARRCLRMARELRQSDD